MDLEFINEFQIDKDLSTRINALLSRCFPETSYQGRDHFKQLPHYRILAIQGKEVVGQLGIDLRVMNLNGKAVNVFGVIDLCVDPDFQGKGVGTDLMIEFERIAKTNSDKVDFLFLVSDRPAFYYKLGFETTEVTSTWLKIDNHKTLRIGNERIDDAFFLVKRISDKKWEGGELDLLGYMY